MQTFLKPGCKPITIDVNGALADSISKVKAKIQNQGGVDEEQNRLFFDGDQYTYSQEQVQQEPTPISRQDEPNMYEFPKGLHPNYRNLPFMVRLGLVIPSLYLAAATSLEGSLFWLSHMIHGADSIGQQGDSMQMLFFCLFKTGIIFLASNFALEEAFAHPSRISTQDLIARHHLPSKLSNYNMVNLPDGQSLGVHSLQYDSPNILSKNINKQAKPYYSALYMNHGFGASSLSWLPAIPKLTKRLNVKKTLAHDAVGFGFTDRPENVHLYTPNISSEIGLQILNDQNADTAGSSIVLMGHSMGSYATLEMASKLSEDISVIVVLVAPALALLQRTEEDVSPPSQTAEFLQSYVVGPPMHYFLRRIVGMQNFWKQGLKLAAWGDSKLVTDSDALRFQWPSIGEGWEQGLLRYARAVSGLSNGKDVLHRAASRPNTRIVVILGEKDKVISRATVEKVCGPYPEISIAELEGCGHDPFEENVDGFVDLVEKLLHH